MGVAFGTDSVIKQTLSQNDGRHCAEDNKHLPHGVVKLGNVFQFDGPDSEDDVECAVEDKHADSVHAHIIYCEVLDESKCRCEHDQETTCHTLGDHKLPYSLCLILDLFHIELEPEPCCLNQDNKEHDCLDAHDDLREDHSPMSL